MKLTNALKTWLADNCGVPRTFTEDQAWTDAAVAALKSGKLTQELLGELSSTSHPDNAKRPNAQDAFGNVKVKGAKQRLSTTKSPGRHARTGEPVIGFSGKAAEMPSQYENALCGTIFKLAAIKSGMQVHLSELDRELLEDAYQQDWCGKVNGQWETAIPGQQMKAVLNDSNSGGVYAVPVVFDEVLVTLPLLTSELLPFVDLRDISRGNSVQGATVGTPSITWGALEGSSNSTFNTDSLIGELTTSLHPCLTAIEIGKDFLHDSPSDFGRILMGVVAEALQSDLDRTIIAGNGTTEPVGIISASGMTDIGNPAGGSGAVPQVDDYEALYFATGKQYRQPGRNTAFVGTDTSYKRARAIPVGASDARRIFGMDHKSYQLLGERFAINNSMGNANAVFGSLLRYRLYRSAGFEMKFVDTGKELSLKNLSLLMVRGRFGGRVVDGAAFSYSDNWKS